MPASNLRITIPEPCDQQWKDMQPVDIGKAHCSKCDRVLTDFSKMSDTELALWFMQTKGKICGIFANEQLNRAITLPAEKPRKKYWLSALWLIPLTWFAKPAQAQSDSSKTTATCHPYNPSHLPAVGSELPEAIPAYVKQVKGKVTGGNTLRPLENVVVMLYSRDGKEEIARTYTDAKGHFAFDSVATDRVRKTGGMLRIYSTDGYDGMILSFPHKNFPADGLNVCLSKEEYIRKTAGVPPRHD